MDNETEEANKALAASLEKQGIEFIRRAAWIAAGKMADYDVIASVGADVAILARALNKYQKSTPYGRKQLGINQEKP